MIRLHLNKPDVPQTKEEVFFALVVAVLPLLDARTILSLYQDAEIYADADGLSGEVRGYFMSAVADLGPEQRSEINNYSKWRAGQEEQRSQK